MIRLDNISKQHGKQILFLEASAAVNRGEKVGLVGPNGAGKTTIFRMITGEEQPDDGQVAVDRGVTIGYFSQDVGEMAGRSAVAETMDGAGPVCAVGAELQRARARARRSRSAPTSMEELVERFGEVQARFEELGGYALEARAREILAGLGFCAGDDGRRRRRALGRLEDARGAGAHPAHAARRAAARRADQPPRPRV